MQNLGGKHKRGARGSLEEELSTPKRANMAECQGEEAAELVSADPRSTVFFLSANPLNLSLKSAIRAQKRPNPPIRKLIHPLSVTVREHGFSTYNPRKERTIKLHLDNTFTRSIIDSNELQTDRHRKNC